MKKSIVIIAGLLLLSVIGIVAYFKPKNEITNSNQVSNEHKVTNNNPTINSVVISSSVQSRQVSSSVQPPALTKAVKINAIDAEKLIDMVNSSNNGVNYLSVDESGLPPDEISNLKKDYDNLNKYGSYSGVRLLMSSLKQMNSRKP